MRVLVMMSGGVDSSVAAAMLRDAGHEVVGVTLKLWGGPSDSGCCSISDVDDARRVADRLGLDHHTFNFSDEFTRHVVGPYVDAHAMGQTPNPCIECNRHLKFSAVLDRARRLGFDAVATGHHARVVTMPGGRRRISRGADDAKDQSYVLHMLDQDQLARTLLPIGELSKDEVRARAADLDLRTADKPDSQDVCFITKDRGRGAFLRDRIPLTPARVEDRDGRPLATVTAVELVTHGQRRGLGLPGGTEPRYVVDIDRDAGVITVGSADDLLVETQDVTSVTWSDPSAVDHLDGLGIEVAVQTSAHGRPAAARVRTLDPGRAAELRLRWHEPHRRIAPGQSIVFYDGDTVLGGGIARRSAAGT